MKNVINKLTNYKKELEAINEELTTLPEGYLLKRKKFYWQVINGKEIGITKSPKIIQQLCRKKYLLVRQKQLTHNFSTPLNQLNKLDNRTPSEIIQEFSKAYQGLPKKYFFHPSIEPWLSKVHKMNPYPIESIYHTKNGIQLRSKSELLIANLLEEYEIPYKYDIAFALGEKTIYPDFQIKNLFTGKFIIWEHFGALNQPSYEQQMHSKMEGYTKRGYIPFETLIYTFEFDIDSSRLQSLIENVIL